MNALLQLRPPSTKPAPALANKHIGTQAHAGLVDVVRAVPPKGGRGRYTVTVPRADLTAVEAVDLAANLPRWLVPAGVAIFAVGLGASLTDTASAAVVRVIGFGMAAAVVVIAIFR